MDQLEPIDVVDWVPYVLDRGTEFLFRIRSGRLVRESNGRSTALAELGGNLTHLVATADGSTLVVGGDGFARIAHIDAQHVGINEGGLHPWGFDVPLPPGARCVAALRARTGTTSGVTLVATGSGTSAYIYVGEDHRIVTTPSEYRLELAVAGVAEDRQVVDDLGSATRHWDDGMHDVTTRRDIGRVHSLDAVLVGDQVVHGALVDDPGGTGFVLGEADDIVDLQVRSARHVRLSRGLQRLPEPPHWTGVWVHTETGPTPVGAAMASSDTDVDERFKFDVFVSYKRDDPTDPANADNVERHTEALVRQLKAARLPGGRRIRVWFDRSDAQGRYGITTREAIWQSATFAVLWTARSGIRPSSTDTDDINQLSELGVIADALHQDRNDRNLRRLAMWQAIGDDELGAAKIHARLKCWQITKARPVGGQEPPTFDSWVQSVIALIEESRERQRTVASEER